jgi:hypothetical protein
MKIGFSFGRCVKDIVDNVVNIDDVAVIITRTNMLDAEMVGIVIDQYLTFGPLVDMDSARCQEVAKQLWDSGKLHQPRQYGQSYASRPTGLHWMDLFPSIVDQNPAVTDAWNNYQMMLMLAHGQDIPRENLDESEYKRSQH